MTHADPRRLVIIQTQTFLQMESDGPRVLLAQLSLLQKEKRNLSRLLDGLISHLPGMPVMRNRESEFLRTYWYKGTSDFNDHPCCCQCRACCHFTRHCEYSLRFPTIASVSLRRREIFAIIGQPDPGTWIWGMQVCNHSTNAQGMQGDIRLVHALSSHQRPEVSNASYTWLAFSNNWEINHRIKPALFLAMSYRPKFTFPPITQDTLNIDCMLN